MVKPQYTAKPDPLSEADADGKMGFLDHLDELRSRLIRSCLAIAAGMAIAFVFVDRIADFVLAPAFLALPAGSSLIMTRPGEGLSLYLDLALLGGVVLAAPFVTYQNLALYRTRPLRAREAPHRPVPVAHYARHAGGGALQSLPVVPIDDGVLSAV